MNLDMLRKELKAKREQLPSAFQQAAAEQITQQLIHSNFFQQSKRIASYLPVKGEVSTQAIMTQAFTAHKSCFLPVLHPSNQSRLWFMPYLEKDALISNRYNILEPITNTLHLISPCVLDLIIMPLVAFDLSGNRLGMGAGFYDRTLASLHTQVNCTNPLLIGLAYEFQKVPKLEQQVWDIPLNYVITEQHTYHFKL